jgi:hypothetical protein
MTATDPYGWTIFCDDIRPEMGGKFSFMGVYRGFMFVHSDFPITVAKFGLAISYRINLDDPRLDDVTVEVSLPGDDDKEASMKAVIPVTKMIVDSDPATSVGDTFREFGLNIILSPLRIRAPGLISVRAHGGAGVIRLGSLKVERGPTASAPSTMPDLR